MKETKKNKRKDGLLRQKQIMSVALKLFSDKGYSNTSVLDIINESGIAKRTFYLHFSGKEDILEKIIDLYFSLLYEYIKVLDISIKIPIQDIRIFFVDIAKFLTELPELKQFGKLILRDLMGLNEYFLKKINNFYNAAIDMLADYVKKGQSEGKMLHNLDPRIISICFVGASKEVLFRWLVMEEDIDMKKAINSTIDLFLEGTFIDESGYYKNISN